jgi:hypothetical protein
MSRRYCLSFILFVSCTLNLGRMAASEDAAPRWLSDWEEGRKAARESGKPLFVVFRCQH